MRLVVQRMWQCLMQWEFVTNKAEGVMSTEAQVSVVYMQQLGSSENI